MFIDFILINPDPEEFEDLEDFLCNLENMVPSLRKPISISSDEIIRFEPSLHDNSWTDVFTVDGDILVADMEYAEFKTMFYVAIEHDHRQTWEMLSSDDGEAKIRFYKN